MEETEIIGIKELRKGDTLNVSGIASGEVEFTDTRKNSENFGKKFTKQVFYLKAKVNNVLKFVKVNEGTNVYRQLEKYIANNEMTLPVKLMDETWHIETGSAPNGTYVLITELAVKEDVAKLFE